MPSKATQIAALLGKLAFATGGTRTVGGRVGTTLAEHNQAIIQAELIEEERKRQQKSALIGGTLSTVGTVAGGAFGGPIGASIGGAAGGLLGSAITDGPPTPSLVPADVFPKKKPGDVLEFVEDVDEFGNPIGEFARGGLVAQGGNAVVGEGGVPEIVNLPAGATVTPAVPGGPNAVPAAAPQSPVGSLSGALGPFGTFLGGANTFFQQLDQMPLLQLGLQRGAGAVRGRALAAANAPAPASAFERGRGGFQGQPAAPTPVSGVRQFQGNVNQRVNQFAQNPSAPSFVNTVANSFPGSAGLLGDPNDPDSFGSLFGAAFRNPFRSVGV